MTKLERAKELQATVVKRLRHERERKIEYSCSREEELADLEQRRRNVDETEMEISMYSDLIELYTTRGIS